MVRRSVYDWLLEPDEPSIRFRTLRDLENRASDDPELRESQAQIPNRGWAADILRERGSSGCWVAEGSLYRPKYISTNWKLLVLADLGLTRSNPAVRTSADLWIERFSTPDGGFGTDGASQGHLCLVGNTARAAIQFGYENDPRVRRAMQWLVEHAHHLGGWSCWGAGRNLDSWEGLSAFAVYPRSKWTRGMHSAVENGAEFFLERELHQQGARYPPWYRTHYPTHYYYDLLVGLDLMTALGFADDRRLRFALRWLRERRRPDGRWNLDALHPDVQGPVARWFRDHPSQRPIPFGLEPVGKPSKAVTFLALRILERAHSAGAKV